MNVPQNIIWIGSFPKSGNTWVRAFLGNYLMPTGKQLSINELSEITTSDIRTDWFDKAAGKRFVGHNIEAWVSMRVKVQKLIAHSATGHRFVKTHSKIDRIGDIPLILPEVTAAAIYIIRNPFDVVVSFARHTSIPIDEAIDRMCEPKNMTTTDTGIIEVLGRWDDHIQSWTKVQGLAHHIMRYEDMVANPKVAFRGLLHFLQVSVQNKKLRRALEETSFSAMQKQESSLGFREKPPGLDTFFATGKYGGWVDALMPDQVARIHAEFKPTLEEFFPEVGEQAVAFVAQGK